MGAKSKDNTKEELLTGSEVWSLISPILAPYKDELMMQAYVITFAALRGYDEKINMLKSNNKPSISNNFKDNN